ncbi:MAG: glycosyl hydrolase family 65 protein [Acidimicrobiia bacterium]|nr:glycosyl hydrolase family 65 protein [Acidimicrobiia bacterium]
MSRWVLAYDGYNPEEEPLREALCTLGNGYFATRGAAPESAAGDVHYPGTYVAGLYNRLTTKIADRDIVNEDLVNVPNWLHLRFRAAGEEWFAIDEADVEEYRQELDLRHGVLTRRFVFTDPSGNRTRVAQRRFVHMGNPHAAGLQTTFQPENWSGRMQVEAAIDGTVVNAGVERYRKLNSQHLEPVDEGFDSDDTMHVTVQTTQSAVRIALAAQVIVRLNGTVVNAEREPHRSPGFVSHTLSFDVDEGVPTTVDKVVSLYTSRDHAISEPGRAARAWVDRLGTFDELLESHALAWDLLWDRFHLKTGADDYEAMVLNLHQFHLCQTVSKHTIDLDVGVPARGWHGEAYRGHIFWDELFIFPYLNLHLPDLTHALLLYRYRRLSEARSNAAAAGLEGALYPWQSGSTGREESQVVHLNPKSGNWMPDNSSLQRHINIAVAYNAWQYYQVTGDVDFLAYGGAEMVIEIARLMASLSTYNKAIDRYEILGVMGPDEYHDGYPDRDTPGLDNNAYTNVMASWVLRRAQDALDAVPEFRREELVAKLHVRPEELHRWEEISQKLVVPFHGDGIISQFEGYGDLEEFDWLGYTERYGDIQRLDRILEAEGDSPNRYKLSKQADVLMLFYLLSTDELKSLFGRLGYALDEDDIQRTIDYYDERTSHGSTLSRIVNAWVLARTDRERSWEFFQGALLSDVTDIQGGTTPEGIHLGAMAGTVDLVQRGFTGIETREGVLWLDPSIPEELGELQFDIRYRGLLLDFHITPDRLTVTTKPGNGEPISVGIRDRIIQVPAGTTETVVL